MLSSRNLKIFTLATLTCVVFLLCIVYRYERNDGLLAVYFLDIGQGDSIYVRTPGGHDMLVDGGPSASVVRRLSEVMPWYDKTIDIVMESHPDADHIGGLPDVLKRYNIGKFIEPGIESKNAIDDEIRRLRKEKGIESVLAERGMIIDFGDGTTFKVLFPDQDVSGFKNTNDASIVGQVIYGSTSVMLNGDSPKSIESHLLEIGVTGSSSTDLKSTILKVGHHGSKSSSGLEYVKAVNPEYAVISVGRENRYGHPNKEVIDVLESLQIPILRTDELGTIKFQSDGKVFYKK